MKAPNSSVLIAALALLTQFAAAQTPKPKPLDQAQDTTKSLPKKTPDTASRALTPTPTPTPATAGKSSGAATPQKATGDASRPMTATSSPAASPTPTGKAPVITGPVVPQKLSGGTQPNPTVSGGKTPVINKDTAEQSLGKPKIVDGSKLTKEAFRALPGNAVILLPGGQQTTKQQMLDDAKAKLSKLQSASPKTEQSLASIRAKFEQKQQADLRTRNDKVLAEIARYKSREQAFLQSPSYQTIQNEAVSLHQQYAKASPQEKQRIELRARDLQRQLENLKTSQGK